MSLPVSMDGGEPLPDLWYGKQPAVVVTTPKSGT